MAKITFIEDVLDQSKDIVEINKNQSLKEVCDSYFNSKNEDTLQYEVYNVETGETYTKSAEITSYKVLCFVNGEETTLDYIIKDNDTVTVMYIPQNRDAADFFSILGGILMVAGAVAMVIPGIGTVAGGIIMAIGGACSLVGLVIASNIKGPDTSHKNESKEETESLLSLGDGGNQPLLNQRYPFVFGKHIVNPAIVGSGYHETNFEKNSIYLKEGESQYYHKLYTTGYGPQKITDIKIGNVILAYNRSYKNQVQDTVFHGQISEMESKNKAGEILKKWENNDPKLEFLQNGGEENSKEVYGTIFPQVVEERQVNEALLHIQDNKLTELANTTYKNTSIPIGFRSNTVKFSHDCPQRIEVELEAQQGLFGVRTRTTGGDNKTTTYKYYRIPLTVAVQWRFMREGEPSSDAESGEGWNTFDTLNYGGGEIKPVPYHYVKDSNNDGYQGLKVSPSNLEDGFFVRNTQKTGLVEYNSGWDNYDVFRLNEGLPLLNGKPVLKYRKVTKDIKYDTLVGMFTPETNQQALTYLNTLGLIKDLKDVTVTKVSVGKITTGSFGFRGRTITVTVNCTESYYANEGFEFSYPEYSKGSLNVNARRWVFSKTFTEDECRKMVGYNTNEKIGGSIEVRVIRLTPNYLDETGDVSSKDEWGKFAYQDLVHWTYLRSYCFDKQNYLEALNRAEDPKKIKVEDYPLRPFSLEDSRKFSYIALSLKQDAMDTAGSSMNDMSCIVQHLGAKYNAAEDRWEPSEINRKYKFSKKEKVDGKWKITRISEEEYEKNKFDSVHYWKENDGTDITDKIKADIKEDGFISNEPFAKYKLSNYNQIKYISNNTANVGIHSFTGLHNGIDQYTYDWLDLPQWKKFRNFCDDVTDGSTEQFVERATFRTDIDLTNRPKVPASTMRKSGYDVADDEIATVYSTTITDKDEDPTVALVMTPIKVTEDSYTVLTENELHSIAQKNFDSGEYEDGVFLYRFDGTNCVERAKYYDIATHVIQAILYGDESDEEIAFYKKILKEISKSPINALYSGVKEELIKYLCTFKDLDIETYYSYFLLALEQHSQGVCKNPICKLDDGLKHFTMRCNGVINNEQKLETFISKVMLTGRANLIRTEDNKYAPLIGQPNPYPVALLNQRNVLSKSNTRVFSDRIAGTQYSYIDEADNYVQNNLYVMDDGEDWQNPSAKVNNATMEYVTDKYQLFHLGRYNLAILKYQVEVYTRTVGTLGYALALGDTILLQDDSLLVGTDKGGRIQSLIESDNYIYGFITDEPFEYTGELETDESKEEFGLSVQGVTVTQPEKYGASRCVTQRLCTPKGIKCESDIKGYKEQLLVNNNLIVKDDEYILQPTVGLTNVIIFEYPITKSTELSDESAVNGEFRTFQPNLGNLVAFGNVDTTYIKATLMGIKPKEKNQFELNLVPYTPELYTAGGEIPIFEPKMTKDRGGESFQFSTEVTAEQLQNTVEELNNLINDNYNEATNNIEPPKELEDLVGTVTRDGIRITAISSEVSLQQSVTRIIYELSRDDGVSWTTPEKVPLSYFYSFDRNVDGYPEWEGQLAHWLIRAKAVNVYGTPSETYKTVYLTRGNYGTWKIPVPKIVKATPDANKVSVELKDLTYEESYWYAAPFLTNVEVNKNDGNGFIAIEGQDYHFIRNNTVKEYYEGDVLADWKVRAYYTSNNRGKGNYSGEKFLDIDHYGTWKVTSPIVNARVSDRSVTMTFAQFRDDVYGNIKYGLRICRPNIDRVNDEYNFRTPDLSINPYLKGNELKYAKDSDDYFYCTSTFGQILPLEGQDSDEKNSITDTLYYYEIIAENEAGSAVYIDINTGNRYLSVTATATSIRDIVKANETVKEQYVEALSAICANIGLIQQGGLGDFDNQSNYWALSDLDTDVTGATRKVYRGEFRVGNNDEYIWVRPKMNEYGQFIDEQGNVVSEPASFEIKFRVGSFEVTSEGNDFTGRTIIYDKNDLTKRLKLTSTGFVIQRCTDTAKDIWEDVGQITLDTNGNMFFSNDPSISLERRVPTPDPLNSHVFHFNSELDLLKDEKGESASKFGITVTDGTYSFVKTDESEQSPVSSSFLALNSQVKKGYLEKTFSDDGEMGVFTNSNIFRINGIIYKTDGEKSKYEKIVENYKLMGLSDLNIFKESI